ncbi:GNAT family N-acetyltransferase [Haloplanus salilacus]|uniref:GNAT family N-acetyltransferase n=1 Tax=Haloplanus salilacus TaxID=2949994 RepID=UPI0030D33786
MSDGSHTRLPPRIDLRPAEPVDRSEMTDLWERRTGFEITKVLDAVFDDEKPAHGVVATEVERVVGFGVVIRFPRDAAVDWVDVALEGRDLGESVAVFHAGVVAPEWEGNGIGTALMRARLDFVRDAYDVDAAVGIAWLRPHTRDASALFERTGFERHGTDETYYRRVDRPVCPDCGDVCECRAAVYVWTPDG